jgi:hypothetical protein
MLYAVPFVVDVVVAAGWAGSGSESVLGTSPWVQYHVHPTRRRKICVVGRAELTV